MSCIKMRRVIKIKHSGKNTIGQNINLKKLSLRLLESVVVWVTS